MEEIKSFQEEYGKIKVQIERMGQMQRLFSMLIRFSVMVCFGILIYIVFVVVNFAFPVPTKTSQYMLYGQLLLLLAMTIFYVIRPALDKIKEEELALMIEKRYPQLYDRFICSVEMNQKLDADLHSPDLVKALWTDTDKVRKVLKLDLKKAVALQSGKRYIVIALSLMVLACVSSIVAPEFILKSTSGLGGVNASLKSFLKPADLSADVLKQKDMLVMEQEKKERAIEATKDLLAQQKRLNMEMKQALKKKNDEAKDKIEEMKKSNPALANKAWMPQAEDQTNWKTGGFSGIVLKDGKPAEGLYVGAKNLENEITIAGKTDKKGKFVIKNLIIQGGYNLWVLNKGVISNPEGLRGLVCEENVIKDGFVFNVVGDPAYNEDHPDKKHDKIDKPDEHMDEFFHIDKHAKNDKIDTDKQEAKMRIILPEIIEGLPPEAQAKLQAKLQPKLPPQDKVMQEMAEDLKKQKEKKKEKELEQTNNSRIINPKKQKEEEEENKKPEAAQAQKEEEQKQQENKEEMAQKMQEMAEKMQKMEEENKLNKEEKEKKAEQLKEEVKKMAEELAKLNKEEKDKENKENNKEMAEQLKKMAEEMEKNKELKDKQEDLKKQAEEMAKDNKENKEENKEKKENMEKTAEKMEKAEDKLQENKLDKALEEALAAEKKLEEELNRLNEEKDKLAKELEDKQMAENKKEEESKADANKKEEQDSETLNKEKLDDLQKKLEEEAKKAKDARLDEKKTEEMLKDLEEALKKIADDKAKEDLKKQLEEAKKELAEDEKEQKERGDKDEKEAKRNQRAQNIAKKLQSIANLLGELKNRAFMAKAYGVEDVEIADMVKDEVPARYKNLVEKYRVAISR